jgi:hypothetical protein
VRREISYSFSICGVAEKLTSDKLEGLGYELVAVLAVLVVRHDCDGGVESRRGWVWRQWQAACSRSGDGSEVVRSRWFDPKRIVHTQFARRFPGEPGPRALSICVPHSDESQRDDFDPPRRRLLSTFHPNCKDSTTATMFKATRALSMQPTRMMAMQPTRMMAMRQSPQLFMRQTMRMRNPVPVCLAEFSPLAT